MTIRTLLIAAAAVALAGTAQAQDTVKVGVAAEPYPPFTVPDAGGNWSGWEVEIMEAICAEAELNCEITPTAWDGIIPALNAGKIDVIMSSMSITEERDQQIDFSNKYYRTPAAIVAAQGADFEISNEGLSGMILGVQTATIHERYARKHFPDAEVRQYQTQDEANQDLVAGRLDAIQADAITLDAFLSSSDGSACCVKIGNVPDDAAVLGKGVGAGIREADDELEAKLNDAIAAIRADGTYQEITAKYFSSDIYGD